LNGQVLHRFVFRSRFVESVQRKESERRANLPSLEELVASAHISRWMARPAAKSVRAGAVFAPHRRDELRGSGRALDAPHGMPVAAHCTAMKKRPQTVNDLMSKDVLCLAEEQDLRHLDDAMRLLKFRHMPVTADGRLVGIVTQRDVLRLSASSLLPGAKEQTAFLARTFLVRDVMIRNVKTVTPGTALSTAARLLLREKLGCLPVVDDRNVVVGILTESDFVRFATQVLED
jgi:CBS domain-containing protein